MTPAQSVGAFRSVVRADWVTSCLNAACSVIGAGLGAIVWYLVLGLLQG